MLERFDRNRHRFLPDGAWLKGVKRQARKAGCSCTQRVFLYQSIETGRFVVAVRGDSRPGPPLSFVPVESMMWHPDFGPPDRPSPGAMTVALLPASRTFARAQRVQAEDVWREREAKIEQDAARLEYARKCEKMGDHTLAKMVRENRAPFAAPTSFEGTREGTMTREQEALFAEMVVRAAYEQARHKTGWHPATMVKG